LKIIILGTRGLPPRYGGRETASDEIGRRLVDLGHDVVVYGRSGNGRRRERHYHGIRVVDLPTVRTKGLDSLVHVLLSTLDLALHGERGVVVLSDVGTSIALPLLWLTGHRAVWWVDGPAWERSKWGWFARNYLRAAAVVGIRLAHEVVIDSRSAARYYERRFRRSVDYIPYGASVAEVGAQDRWQRAILGIAFAASTATGVDRALERITVVLERDPRVEVLAITDLADHLDADEGEQLPPGHPAS